MKPFMYVVIQHPTENEKKNGKQSFILTGLSVILASDEAQARLKIAHSLQIDTTDIDRIEVAVKPF